MPQSFLSQASFEALADQSRRTHGSQYVLPVAAWIELNGLADVAAGEVVRGLGGQVERVRAIDALAKLAQIGALIELPRAVAANAPRNFTRAANPYWTYVGECLAAAEGGSERAVWGGPG